MLFLFRLYIFSPKDFNFDFTLKLARFIFIFKEQSQECLLPNAHCNMLSLRAAAIDHAKQGGLRIDIKHKYYVPLLANLLVIYIIRMKRV